MNAIADDLVAAAESIHLTNHFHTQLNVDSATDEGIYLGFYRYIFISLYQYRRYIFDVTKISITYIYFKVGHQISLDMDIAKCHYKNHVTTRSLQTEMFIFY